MDKSRKEPFVFERASLENDFSQSMNNSFKEFIKPHFWQAGTHYAKSVNERVGKAK